MTQVTDQHISNDTKLTEWLDQLSFDLHIEKTKAETGTLDEKMKRFYTELMNGEMKMFAEVTQRIHTDYYKKKITLDFIKALSQTEAHVLKLALDYNQTSILVWSEINDDDERSENALIMLQAKINADFIDSGFRVNATIVEKSDKFIIPSHYTEIKVSA